LGAPIAIVAAAGALGALTALAHALLSRGTGLRLWLPIHLWGSVAAGVGLLTLRWSKADEVAANPDSWALLSDTHLSGNRDEIKNEVNMFKNLEQISAEIRALSTRPAGLMINGDLALLDGKPADYQLLAEMMSTLSGAEIPVHLAMGNHDHRDNFWQAFADAKAHNPPVASRQITLIETPRVNWLMLDSLVTTNTTPGKLGEEQIKWVAAALDARPDKPAIVMVHHNPDPMNPKSTALTDTDPFYEVLVPRRQVKAYIFGHTHHWNHKQHEGIHLINLPATAYPFKKGDPNGWVHCTLGDGGAKFELRALDTKNARHGETLDLKWRA